MSYELCSVCCWRWVVTCLSEDPCYLILLIFYKAHRLYDCPKLNWLKWSIDEMACRLILLTHPWWASASLTVELRLSDAAKTLGAMSLGRWSWTQALRQKEVFAPSPIVILVAATKRRQPVLLQGFLSISHGASGLAHSSHSQRNHNALANLSESSIPRPSRFIGRVTVGQL
jgi:hypothetical protein